LGIFSNLSDWEWCKIKIYILQGIPGSGKSYHATSLDSTAVICSADNYPGLYPPGGGFNAALLGQAHGACFRTAVEAVQADRSVIVDNTSLTVVEMAPYVALAQAYNAAPIIIRVQCDPKVALARNKHGVPPAAHAAMAKRLEEFVFPPYWRFIPGFEYKKVKGS